MRRDAFPLVFGVLVSTLLAGTLVIAGLKAGITPGVSPLVVLFAWGAFTKRISSGGGTRFLNIAQVAGSAGMAVTAGVIFTAPLVQILHSDRGLPVPEVDVVTLIILSLAGALVGFGFVGLTTKKFLNDPTLPAPEARACETMIEAAVADKESRPRLGRSLYAGMAASFLAPLFTSSGAASEHVVLLEKEQDDRRFQLDLPFTPIYIGIGGLLTLATAMLVFAGSMLRLIGDWALASIGPAAVDSGAVDVAAQYPANSMRWVGGGAMTVAVAYSMKRFLAVRNPNEPGVEPEKADPLTEVDQGRRSFQVLAVIVGMVIASAWLVWRDGFTPFTIAMTVALFVCAALMVVLGAILSLQIGSSASPVSGTIFVTTLVLCVTAVAVGRREMSDVILLTPLLVGACVAVCTANDSSQDYKTMQLCGVRVQEGFLAQLLGLIGGCIAVPIVLYIAHNAFTLGSEDLPAPQGQLFATLMDGLLLSQETPLPIRPILIGLAVGLGAVVMDVLGQSRKIQLPSMALAVGIYLPPYLGIGILLGAFFRWIAEGGRKQENESILAAAGLITGAALFELILGSLIVFAGFDPDALEVIHMPGFLMDAVGVIGILALAAILFLNSRPRS